MMSQVLFFSFPLPKYRQQATMLYFYKNIVVKLKTKHNEPLIPVTPTQSGLFHVPMHWETATSRWFCPAVILAVTAAAASSDMNGVIALIPMG